MRAPLAAVVLAVACGGGPSYDGTPGQPQPVSFPSLIPVAPVTIDGTTARSYGLDTGSPGTLVDVGSYPGRPLGNGTAAVGVLGLRVPDVSVQTGNYFAGDGALGGLVGANVLSAFAFSLDYKGARAWLSDPFAAAALPADLGVGAEVDLPFALIGADRVLVQIAIEGHAPVWALVDTGATAVTLEPGLVAELGDAAGRPHLDGLQVITVYGQMDGYWTRVWRVAAADASVDDVEAIVVPGSTLFTALSLETQRPVRALLGGKFLRSFATTIDYQAGMVRLARYLDPTHIDPDEWIGPGFRATLSGVDWTITTVYPGSDAAAKGVLVGDELRMVDGTATTGLPSDAVDALLRDRQVGSSLTVELVRADQTIVVQILVEDLLPHYPPPT